MDLGFNQQLVVAMGGEGGEGSAAVGNKGRGVKRARTGPVGGEKKRLKLTLKVVADVALVAVPNAGKSTTLASATRAKPKISNVSVFCFLLHVYFVPVCACNELMAVFIPLAPIIYTIVSIHDTDSESWCLGASRSFVWGRDNTNQRFWE